MCVRVFTLMILKRNFYCDLKKDFEIKITEKKDYFAIVGNAVIRSRAEPIGINVRVSVGC